MIRPWHCYKVFKEWKSAVTRWNIKASRQSALNSCRCALIHQHRQLLAPSFEQCLVQSLPEFLSGVVHSMQPHETFVCRTLPWFIPSAACTCKRTFSTPCGPSDDTYHTVRLLLAPYSARNLNPHFCAFPSQTWNMEGQVVFWDDYLGTLKDCLHVSFTKASTGIICVFAFVCYLRQSLLQWVYALWAKGQKCVWLAEQTCRVKLQSAQRNCVRKGNRYHVQG